MSSARRFHLGIQGRVEGKARSFGENIESDLASRFLRVVEVAAIASARTMGQGERKLSDQVATEAMRRTMDSIPMRGTIVLERGRGLAAERRRLAVDSLQKQPAHARSGSVRQLPLRRGDPGRDPQ